MSARRLSLYLGLGALAYAVALAATLPAAWVSHAVGRATQERMVLRDEAGSAWSGSGRLYARQRSGQLVDLGALRWRAQPASLLGGKLHAELTFDDTGKMTSLDFSPTSVTVQGLDIEFPGVVLAAIEPALEALGPEGVVRLRADRLRIDADSMLGLADIEWRGIRLARAHDLDLGSQVARLRGGGSKVDIELGTLSGPLELRGGGTWVRRSGFSISGSAEPRNAELAAFLRSVCAEYRDSRCTFRYSRGL